MKNYISQPNLPLDTPLILRAWSKITWECFEKRITYKEWIEFDKHANYEYLTFKIN
jgi:hypothetical protein